MAGSQLITHCGANKLFREQLKAIPAPDATETYQPLAHYAIVDALLEALAFRHISVVRDEYAVSEDGMKMFGGSISKPHSRRAVFDWHSQFERQIHASRHDCRISRVRVRQHGIPR